jgi:hypothetical protein
MIVATLRHDDTVFGQFPGTGTRRSNFVDPPDFPLLAYTGSLSRTANRGKSRLIFSYGGKHALSHSWVHAR